jgi:hypothetical protein
MRICWTIILLVYLPVFSAAQWGIDTGKVTRQCSAIRELVYQAINQQFKEIIESESRSSYGHQTMGSWKFSTTRYNVNFQWTDASICYLEHSQESTDSFKHDTWQYIAEYRGIKNVLDAEKMYRQLNAQIEGCKYPLSDSVEVNFIPLPIDKLPPERPAALEIASVYELPAYSVSEALPSPINVMVGMERRKQDFRVSLIVEFQQNEESKSQ